ncbi:MAG: substrate-binding domain-containing protein [Pirellulaceae bacterium]|nr:substrate-binding domain-containing protein [Pirellulaceae bacterium]
MNNRSLLAAAVGLLLGMGLVPAEEKSLPAVRCAVIGGLIETELWPDQAARFERASGRRVELVASGPKHVVVTAFAAGEADLLVMHNSDAIINLVADGLGENPQPWARNDMILVGPAADPAKIKGEKDAVAALRKIIESKSKFVVHGSNGASEVIGDVLAAGELTLDPDHAIVLPGDKHRQSLARAADEGAYTLIGRIPFLNGKVPAGDLQIMVQGDPRLRRPYLVVVATGPADDTRLPAARELAAFLRNSATQRFIASYGRGKYDDQPLFFPVVVPGAMP